ncbi:vWA domain-containing protein [Desulfolithobacter dissulfuricans]|nr:VWA-like domain-containing protein [Desulfolithobacter dissulfuricans]
MAAKIKKALTSLVLSQPFFGSLALRLKLVEDPSCDTAWVNGKTLGYNPEFIAGLSFDEVKGILAHEVMHCALGHHARRQQRNKDRWNIACDYAVNAPLLEAGFVLPDGALHDSSWAGYSAERIYNLLPQDSDGSGQSEPQPDQPDQPGQSGSGPGQSNGTDPGGCGEVRDCPGSDGRPATPSEIAQSEREWKTAMNQALTQAKAMGKVPGGMERLVKEMLEPKVNWADVLRNFLETAARNDYSWLRPNRNYLARGFYTPSLYSRELGDVVVAVDTSGSISQDDLNQFGSEISAILEEYNTTVHVIYCDYNINAVESFSQDDLPLKLKPFGGGGTDFRPPFQWVEDNQVTPVCLVYLTDLYCDRYPPEPDYPVLWVYPQHNHWKIPEWGEAISM